jgi:hypothetical protein
MDTQYTYSKFQTFVGVIVVLIAWRILYQLLVIGFNLLTFLNINTNVLQLIFQEVISPGVA